MLVVHLHDRNTYPVSRHAYAIKLNGKMVMDLAFLEPDFFQSELGLL